MKLFLILLIIISSYTLVSPSTFFISLVFLGLASFLAFKNYKKDKKFLLFLLIIFIFFLAIKNLNFRTFQSSNSFYGIIIKKKDNYFIVFDGIERFYVKSNDTSLDMLDIIKLDGNFANYSSQPVLESGFDFKNYLAERGINRQIFANTIDKLFNFPFNSCEYKTRVINQFESESAKTLIKSLMFGEVNYDDSLIKELRISGSFILVALSGIHINGLYSIIEKTLSRFVRQNKEIYITYILFIPWFLINIFNITFIRIFISKTFYLIKEKKNLNFDALESKSIIYLSILILNKYALSEISMQIGMSISFLLYFCSTLLNQKRKIFRKFFSSLIVFLILIPFNLSITNSFNISNLSLNLLFTPLINLILLIIFPSMFFLKFSFMELILDAFYKLLKLINIHVLNINGPELNQYLIVLYFALIIALIYFSEVHNIRAKIVNLFLIIIFGFLHLFPLERFNSVEISFINIGQGDSAFIRLKNENILIDTGGSLYHDLATENLIPYFRKNKIYKIDKVYISHYDTDHFYALDSLKKYFIVDEVVDYNNFYEYKSDEIHIQNLNVYSELFTDENSKSLVLYAEIYNRTFLFTGDAPKEIEKAIIIDNPNLNIDYLKVGHHGSNTSSLDDFIRLISPQEAIISCGVNNSYDHPNKEVLRTLTKYKIKIRRTDLEGTIKYKFFV